MISELTISNVAVAIANRLGGEWSFTAANALEGLDAEMEVTERVGIQIGADYLMVNAWVDRETIKFWPARGNIRRAMDDLQDALARYPVAAG